VQLEVEIEVMRNLRLRLHFAASKLGTSEVWTAVLDKALMGRGLTCLSLLPYNILPVST